MFGSLRDIQLQSACSLIQVPIPPHATIYYTIFADIASMDLFETENWLEENFEYKEKDPFNEFFDRYGMGSSTMMLCSGPFFVILPSILSW